MAVLSFVEVSQGKIKKASVEAAYYGSKVAEGLGTDSVAVVLGAASADELATLGTVGVKKVLHAADARFNNFDSKAFSKSSNFFVTVTLVGSYLLLTISLS